MLPLHRPLGLQTRSTRICAWVFWPRPANIVEVNLGAKGVLIVENSLAADGTLCVRTQIALESFIASIKPRRHTIERSLLLSAARTPTAKRPNGAIVVPKLNSLSAEATGFAHSATDLTSLTLRPLIGFEPHIAVPPTEDLVVTHCETVNANAEERLMATTPPPCAARR